jgi:hypothetical protein
MGTSDVCPRRAGSTAGLQAYHARLLILLRLLHICHRPMAAQHASGQFDHLTQTEPLVPRGEKQKSVGSLASSAKTCTCPQTLRSALLDTARFRPHTRRSMPLTPMSKSLWRLGHRPWRCNKSSTPFNARASPSPPGLQT